MHVDNAALKCVKHRVGQNLTVSRGYGYVRAELFKTFDFVAYAPRLEYGQTRFERNFLYRTHFGFTVLDRSVGLSYNPDHGMRRSHKRVKRADSEFGRSEKQYFHTDSVRLTF